MIYFVFALYTYTVISTKKQTIHLSVLPSFRLSVLSVCLYRPSFVNNLNLLVQNYVSRNVWKGAGSLNYPINRLDQNRNILLTRVNNAKILPKWSWKISQFVKVRKFSSNVRLIGIFALKKKFSINENLPLFQLFQKI